MSADTVYLTRRFFAAARALACHRGTLQERLADAYADNLLAISIRDLPAELQAVFQKLEQRMNLQTDTQEVDPIALAASHFTDEEAQSLIERILILYGRMAAIAGHH